MGGTKLLPACRRSRRLSRGVGFHRSAAAFDRRGAHPKIAAWDSSLYVNTDGSKSIHGVNQSNVFRHQRLKYKMMLQFHRSSSSGGSIRQLGLQDWSDKPLNLPKG